MTLTSRNVPVRENEPGVLSRFQVKSHDDSELHFPIWLRLSQTVRSKWKRQDPRYVEPKGFYSCCQVDNIIAAALRWRIYPRAGKSRLAWVE